MGLQKVSDQGKLMNDAQPVETKAEMKKDQVKDRSWAVLSKSQQLHQDELARGAHSVRSAGAANMSDMGGPSKQIKLPSSNTIAEPEKLATASKTKTAREESFDRIKAERDLREAKKNNWHKLADALKDADTRKGNSVMATNPENTFSNYNTKIPSHQMSIFGNQDFENLPKQTHGEEIATASRKEKAKDRSWADVKKAVSTRSITDTMMDNLLKKESQ